MTYNVSLITTGHLGDSPEAVCVFQCKFMQNLKNIYYRDRLEVLEVVGTGILTLLYIFVLSFFYCSVSFGSPFYCHK